MSHPWRSALVTGASSGIGEEIARRLAGSGVELVLVARSGDRLEALAAELRTAGSPGVEVLVADLGTGEGLAAVEARLADDGRPVDLLVNNAGVGAAGRFLANTADRLAAMIELNVVAPVRLTRAAASGMVARGRGWIMNVSSLASLQATPGLATYAASKAFVTNFSEGVHEELRGTGVSVTAVLPGFTRTRFQASAGYEDEQHGLPAFAWQEPGPVAAEALAATAAGRARVVCGPVNKVAAVASAVLPRVVVRRTVDRATRGRS
ncbi:MAG: SDR family NAD(P)-dependent oxidoreductase [Acidimicrobiia bacterium]